MFQVERSCDLGFALWLGCTCLSACAYLPACLPEAHKNHIASYECQFWFWRRTSTCSSVHKSSGKECLKWAAGKAMAPFFVQLPAKGSGMIFLFGMVASFFGRIVAGRSWITCKIFISNLFLDAIASPCSYPCKSVSGSVSQWFPIFWVLVLAVLAFLSVLHIIFAVLVCNPRSLAVLF